MIPILFESTETAFTGNGLGRLTDCTRCEVTEERNGIYECAFDYPATGKMFDSLTIGRYIFVTHDDKKDPQAFQIYYRSAPLQGVVTFRAWHISYLLNNVILTPFTATSCADALDKMEVNTINSNPFSFFTDKAVSGPYTIDVPTPVRAALGGSSGSILDVYGTGEYEFDMWDVSLKVNRGSNHGVSIRYGKNLVSLDHQFDASNQYVAAVPYWKDVDGNVVSLDHAVYRTGSNSGRIITMDLSADFTDAPTTAQLESRAQTILDGSDNYEVQENIAIDFVMLWQTEEYKNFSNLQRVGLCDTVNIFYEKLGINATAKVIKVVYDSLRERYVQMELGKAKTSLSQQIMQTTATQLLGDVPNRSQMASAIDKATELIAGGFGGYIKFKYLSDGTPSEMLIMDTADESTATNIIRLNQNGLGFSTDGGVTYANAWTIDGVLNADFINTGVLSSPNNKFSLDMISGIVNMASANITGGSINIETNSQSSDVIKLAYDNPYINTHYENVMRSSSQKYSQTSTDANNNTNEYRTLVDGGLLTSSKYTNGTEVRSVQVQTDSVYVTDYSLGSMLSATSEYLRVSGLQGNSWQPWLALTMNGLQFYDSNGDPIALYPNAPSSFSITRDNLPSGGSDYSHGYRLGNVVTVQFAGHISAGTVRRRIASGLPSAPSEAYGVLCNTATKEAISVVITWGSTELLTDTVIASDGYYMGQIVYITG